jgi:hypothetical protein
MIKMMKRDFLNKDLAQGDFVALAARDYKNLIFAKVVNVSKKIQVIYLIHTNKSQLYSTSDVIKIDANDLEKIHPETRSRLEDAYHQYIIKQTLKIKPSVK